jgi:hypothetical protein
LRAPRLTRAATPHGAARRRQRSGARAESGARGRPGAAAVAPLSRRCRARRWRRCCAWRHRPPRRAHTRTRRRCARRAWGTRLRLPTDNAPRR